MCSVPHFGSIGIGRHLDWIALGSQGLRRFSVSRICAEMYWTKVANSVSDWCRIFSRL